VNTNETTDNQGFRSPDEVEQTIRHFSARNINKIELPRDSNEELNQLKKDIEDYIADLLRRLKDEILTKIETTGVGEKGEKGDKGDRGTSGTFNIYDYFNICE
jgi:hypothetical protein